MVLESYQLNEHEQVNRGERFTQMGWGKARNARADGEMAVRLSGVQHSSLKARNEYSECSVVLKY